MTVSLINPYIVVPTPVTYTFYGVTADDMIDSSDSASDYANARAGANLGIAALGSNSMLIGQRTPDGGVSYACWEALIGFDTSSIPDSATITSAVLSIFCDADTSTTDFTVEARLHDWGATVTTADWVAGASVGAKTLLASVSTAGISTVAYTDLTSEAAFISNIDKAGTTRMVLVSDRFRLGTTPTGEERISMSTANTGGAQRPKLVVVAVG